MNLIGKLDNNTKLCASFLILVCVGAALAAWLLAQLGQLQALTAPGGPELSAAAKKMTALALARYLDARNGVLLFLALEVALGAALAVWLVRELGKPLHAAETHAARIAAGDLGTGELAPAGGLARSMHDMARRLAAKVADVRAGVEAIACGAGQVASGSLDLAARNGQQAAMLQEAAAAMALLTANARQNAVHAQQAGLLAVSAANAAARGAAMPEVPGSVEEVARMTAQIAVASAEQMRGLEQLHQAIAAISRASLDNGALVDQSAAAAAAVRDQAASLAGLIAAFTLGPEHARGPVRIELIASNPGQPACPRSARARPRMVSVAAAPATAD